eukprot:GFUD01025857.1.p1 GENE.GFUD01025857.1~~GFUD01025857.1.p1  ORF type:complete len:288 (+),score=49.62 GFUD01025857.1:187-1050(+)
MSKNKSNAIIFLFLYFKANVVILQNSQDIECLVSSELYHRGTRRCYQPLEKGPCQEREWLVSESSISGVGVCQSKLTCNVGEQAYLNPYGGAYCDCEEGKESFRGKCENKFTQSICNQGEILLPRNFLKQNYCPQKFSCTPITNCPGYSKAKNDIGQMRGKKSEAVEFLKSFVCDKKTSSICCPEYDNNSLLSAKTIIRVMNDNPGVLCVTNPCPREYWPWVGEDGVSKCVQYDENVKTCTGNVLDDNGYLICKKESKFDIKFASKSNCGRRRVFKNGRCVRLFRGK